MIANQATNIVTTSRQFDDKNNLEVLDPTRTEDMV